MLLEVDVPKKLTNILIHRRNNWLLLCVEGEELSQLANLFLPSQQDFGRYCQEVLEVRQATSVESILLCQHAVLGSSHVPIRRGQVCIARISPEFNDIPVQRQ